MTDKLPSDVEADPSDNRWVAYELHDGLLQWVVAARMEIESLLQAVEDRPATHTRLREALTHIELALREGRELIVFLEREGSGSVANLQQAIEQYVQAVETLAQKQNQSVTFEDHITSWPTLRPQSRWNLLRIVQQAVRNANSHAGPASITVHCTLQRDSKPEQLRIEIVDDGIGFAPAEIDSSEHFGLAGMRYRAEAVGASLEIDSRPGSGCRVVCLLPLHTST